MIKRILLALSLTASGAAAQDLDLTEQLAAQGLAAAEASLTADDPSTQFALGAVRFLRTIEQAQQLRYRHNADFSNIDIPVLRLPLPANPSPEPFYPGIVTDIFQLVEVEMEAARAALDGVSDDVAVTVDLAQLWFDINENEQRDAGESIVESVFIALGEEMPADGAMPDMTVRFDSADAAWLRAYTHMLSGFANLALAFDPTEVLAEIAASNQAMNTLRGTDQQRSLFLGDDEQWIDRFAILYGTINRQPNPEFTRKAHAHLLQMIAENRAFWAALDEETDNDREWIPNAVQTAALGFEMPPETG